MLYCIIKAILIAAIYGFDRLPAAKVRKTIDRKF